MGKQKDKGAKKGKRTKFTIEQRKFVCALRKADTKHSDISKTFSDRFGFIPKACSLATLYNDEGMKVYEDLFKRDSLMDSVETHINKLQQPTMMVDMDYILMHEYRTAINSGQGMRGSDLHG